jgi:hypothetical protein
MSKIRKSKDFTQNASHTHFVSIMLSIIFLGEKKCDDIFFHILRKRLKNKMSGNNMETFGNKFCEKSAAKFYCKYCDYGTSKKSSYDDHKLSAKHLKQLNGNNIATILDDKSAKICPILPTMFTCTVCSKQFKTRSGLWKHHKGCLEANNSIVEKKQLQIFTDLVKTTLMEVMKNGIVNNTIDNSNHNPIINNSHNTNNSHNKTFNLSVYLNETCKDAINIGDFVSSINVQLEDLEHTGRVGYIEGVSNIIIKNLNNLENHMRPLHCSDFKREVLYIKNNNEWTKEADSKPILTRAIKTIANENIKKIAEWKKEHPDCTSADSKKNNLYLKIVSNSMNGLTKEEGEHNINKIISNIAKETIIQKDKL